MIDSLSGLNDSLERSGFQRGRCPVGDCSAALRPADDGSVVRCAVGHTLMDIERAVPVDPSVEIMQLKEALAAARGIPQIAGLRTLADIPRRKVSWMWHGRIPLGKITVLDGDPGLGKSTLTLDLAARVTTGASMPDGSDGVEGTVVLLSAEDDAADTIGPRFDAAGGDSTRCVPVETIGCGEDTRDPELPHDSDNLEEIVRDLGARLVVIDPVVAFLADDVKTGIDHNIRRALRPLKGLAERTGAAVLIVRHLNKDRRNGSAVHRGGGSIGIIGAARSGLIVGSDPTDPSVRILAVSKANLAAAEATTSLAFRVASAPNGTGMIEWLGESSHSADDLVRPTSGDDGALGFAVEFVRGQLADGPVLSAELERDAKEAGISPATLKRARSTLHVKAEKGFDGKWCVSLPEPQG